MQMSCKWQTLIPCRKRRRKRIKERKRNISEKSEGINKVKNNDKGVP